MPTPSRLTISLSLVGALAIAACHGHAPGGTNTTPPISAIPHDLTELSVAKAAELVRTHAITSVQLTEAYLARADVARSLNAFVTLDRDFALAAARRADAELASGKSRGPLHGVPLVIKDNTHVAGLPSSAGTPALRAFVPKENAPVVQKLIDAGAIVLGKTNMHELAFGISGYNEAIHGTSGIGVRNPYDLTRFAGGSSSGTGAAIAARLAPGGLGTDTGGSIRIPSAVDGIAGLRPTVGRYPTAGIAPISHTRDTPGPMARTVADLALLDAVIAGGAPATPIDLHGIRLGIPRDYFFANLDAGTQAVTATALEKLRAAGAVLVEIEMPEIKHLNAEMSFPVALYEAYDDLKVYLQAAGTGMTVEQVVDKIASADVKATYGMFVVPRKLPGPNGTVDAGPIYQNAITNVRPALQQYYAATFAKYKVEALVFPTVPHVAVVQEPKASSIETFSLFIQNTDPGSNAGVPGLSLPCGMAAGLPVGLELDGPANSDPRLLAIGMAIETVLGPLPAPPPLH
ncbi:MAG TPA: indoleacetamide hydrolase [Kofleriaceae bacterium]|nr:indoleacetamide hydrolase [Kofleriaceae bacterium]